MFGDPVVTTAILDRLLHHSHVITILGDCYQHAAAEFCTSLMQSKQNRRKTREASPEHREPLAATALWKGALARGLLHFIRGSVPHVAEGSDFRCRLTRSGADWGAQQVRRIQAQL